MVLTNGTDTLCLDEGDFRLESVSYDAPKIKNTLAPLGDEKGEMCISRAIGARGVKIVGYISGDLESNRRALYRLCATSPITLIDGEYSLEIVLTEAPALSNERRFKDKLLKYELNALAPSPYWRGEKISETFYGCSGSSTDENAIFISNIGDLPVGCEIKLYFMSGCNYFILKKDEGDFVYNSSTSTLDTVFIDTRYGKKSVTLKGNGSEQRVSVIEKALPSSSFFELSTGENRIDFTVSLGVAYITITYTPLYLR